MNDRSIDGRVQRALVRLYDRLGSRVIYVVCVVNSAIVVAAFAVTSVWVARYLGLSSRDVLVLVALSIFGIPLGAAFILFAWCRDILLPGLSWSGQGRTPARAPEVWESLVRLTGDVTKVALWVDSLGLIPVAVFLAFITDQPAYSAIAFYVSMMASVLVSAALWTSVGNLILRPMLRDVAAHLPDGFEPTAHGWRLRTKALAPLPMVALFGTLTAGAFIDVATRGTARLFLALGIALVTAAIAGLGFLVVTRSTLDPLDELLIATQRVRAGHLDARVLLVTADDLGSLTHSFNRMLVELRRQSDELRASRARIVVASDAERRRVERNIHDGAQQQLVALGIKLRLLEERADPDDTLRTALREIGHRLKAAQDELRELARGLHPPVLTTDGLPPALEQLASRAPVPVTIKAPAERFPEAVESTAYFVASEALANVAKYAQASHAEICVERRNGELVVQIVDDGVGGAHPEPGSGLTGLIDRVAALDGKLSVDSPVGNGTTVTAELPLP